MSAFQYQALNQSGASCKGVIEADSERHARQLLREQGLIPTKLQTTKHQTASFNRNKLSVQDLSLFTRQLATLLAAGIPVEESLNGVSEQTEKPSLRQIIIGVRSKVLEGYALAQALGEYPFAFPELYRATVAAGEQTGRLDLVLEKLADYTEKQQQTRQKIQQALIYPALMVAVSIGIIAFLLTFVVPKIIDVFTQSGQTLPAMTLALIHISDFFKSYGLYCLLFLATLPFLAQQCLKNMPIRLFWHRSKLKIPLVSYLIQSVNVARYIHTFSILFAAGVSVLEAMRVSASLINNLHMKQQFTLAQSRVKEGMSIHLALKKTGFLRPMAVHLIANGEKSGQLSVMMTRAALHLDQEINRLIDTALTLLEPVIILLMGAVVLFIVLATLLPIFSMEQLVV